MVQPCARGTQIKDGGWGYGGVGLGVILKGGPHLTSMRMLRGIAVDAIGLTYTVNGQEILSKFCPTNPSGCCSKHFFEVHSDSRNCGPNWRGDGSPDRGASGLAHHLRHVQGRGPRHDHHRRDAAGETRRQEWQLRGQGLSINKLSVMPCKNMTEAQNCPTTSNSVSWLSSIRPFAIKTISS